MRTSINAILCLALALISGLLLVEFTAFPPARGNGLPVSASLPVEVRGFEYSGFSTADTVSISPPSPQFSSTFNNIPFTMSKPPFRGGPGVTSMFESIIYSLRRGNYSDIVPVSSSLHTIYYRLRSRGGLSRLSLIVEPREYVVGGERLLAHRWYVLTLRSDYLLGVDKIQLFGLLLTTSSGNLLNATCTGNTCIVMNNTIAVTNITTMDLSSTSRILSLNITIPWEIGGETYITGLVIDEYGVSITHRWIYYIINKTEVKNIHLNKHEFRRGERIEIDATITYKNTTIPAINESVNAYIIGESSVYVKDKSSTTNKDGQVKIFLPAPLKPGKYFITVKPLHGAARVVPITVTNEYGGLGTEYSIIPGIIHWLLFSVLIGLIIITALFSLHGNKRIMEAPH